MLPQTETVKLHLTSWSLCHFEVNVVEYRANTPIFSLTSNLLMVPLKLQAFSVNTLITLLVPGAILKLMSLFFF